MAINAGKEQWAKWLPYVKDHIEKQTVETIAKHIGISKRSLTHCIKVWRASGDIPPNTRKTGPIGDLKKDVHLEYIQANADILSLQEIADTIGVTKKDLIAYIFTRKKKGLLQIKDKRGQNKRPLNSKNKKGKKEQKEKKPRKEVIERTVNSIVYLYRYTGNNKYKCVGRKDGQGIPRKTGPPKGYISPRRKAVIEKKRKEMALRPPPKVVKQYPTRVVDESVLKNVRVNYSTIIKVHRDIPDAVAIANYKEKYNKV